MSTQPNMKTGKNQQDLAEGSTEGNTLNQGEDQSGQNLNRGYTKSGQTQTGQSTHSESPPRTAGTIENDADIPGNQQNLRNPPPGQSSKT
jgi:hypothetical protein